MKSMISYLILSTLVIASAWELNGQDLDPRAQERLNAQKVAFFTQRLKLTPEEAEKFWPYYNEYQKRKNILTQERNNTTRTFNQNSSYLSEDEMVELADRYIMYQQKEADLVVEYHEKFKEILPIQKVLRLYQTESMYKTFLLNQLRNRAQNARQRRINR